MALGERHMFGYSPNTIRVSDRCTSVFLNNKRHNSLRLPVRRPQTVLFYRVAAG